jgi:restriction endonuclease S subunit
MRKGWTETILGEVAHIRRERMDPSRVSPDTELFYWSIPGLDEVNGPQVTRASEIGSHKFCVQNDAILYSLLNPRIPRFALADGGTNVVCSTEFAVLEPTQEIDIDYLGVFVSSSQFQYLIGALANGTTKSRERVKASDLESIQFLLPPLEEQKRIVDVVSSIDAYVVALRQQADSARAARNAVLQELLTAGGDNWTETTIGEIAAVKGGKRLPKGTPWSENPTDHPYIRATDIRDGIVDVNNLVYVPDSVWSTISRYVVNSGDVLITIAGTIGAIGIVPESHVGANLTENAALIRPNIDLILPKFLQMFLMQTNAQAQIESLTIGTTQKKLGLFRIESIEIQLPTLAEQERIVEIVSSMDGVVQSTKQAAIDANSLRSGLLSDLLSGNHEIPASYDALLRAA